MAESAVAGSSAATRAPDILEGLHAALRGVILVAGLQYAWLVIPTGATRNALFGALAAFAAYNVVGYWISWRVVAPRRRAWVYATLLALDFVAAVLATRWLAADADRTYYVVALWAALAALTFGLRGGLVAAVVGFVAVLFCRPLTGLAAVPWWAAAHGGALIVDGGLLGYLADTVHRRERELQETRARLDEARQRVVEEHDKLIQAEKLSSIGMLAAGVAHEINNPLSGVMGCVKALRDTEMESQRRHEYFDVVRDGLERIQRTVRGLLDYARRSAPQRQDLDVDAVVTACVQLLAPAMRKKNVTVADRIPERTPPVHANRSQLMQAVVNVLLNAIYAAPNGSCVGIDARRENGRVGIAVRDDGDGISEEVLGRVCDPFFSTKPEGEGTGLGLSITLGIVRAHGGELEFDSNKGAGTRVTIWMPTTLGGRDARDPVG